MQIKWQLEDFKSYINSEIANLQIKRIFPADLKMWNARWQRRANKHKFQTKIRQPLKNTEHVMLLDSNWMQSDRMSLKVPADTECEMLDSKVFDVVPDSKCGGDLIWRWELEEKNVHSIQWNLPELYINGTGPFTASQIRGKGSGCIGILESKKREISILDNIFFQWL